MLSVLLMKITVLKYRPSLVGLSRTHIREDRDGAAVLLKATGPASCMAYDEKMVAVWTGLP